MAAAFLAILIFVIWVGNRIVTHFENSGAFVWFWQKNKQESQSIKQVQVGNLAVEEKSTNTNDETADWKTYRNEKYGFEMKIPQDWIVDSDYYEPSFFGDNNEFEFDSIVFKTMSDVGYVYTLQVNIIPTEGVKICEKTPMCLIGVEFTERNGFTFGYNAAGVAGIADDEFYDKYVKEKLKYIETVIKTFKFYDIAKEEENTKIINQSQIIDAKEYNNDEFSKTYPKLAEKLYFGRSLGFNVVRDQNDKDIIYFSGLNGSIDIGGNNDNTIHKYNLKTNDLMEIYGENSQETKRGLTVIGIQNRNLIVNRMWRETGAPCMSPWQAHTYYLDVDDLGFGMNEFVVPDYKQKEVELEMSKCQNELFGS